MVAKLAQVSSATVSRVYNNPASVSPDLRKRVYEAAEALGYAPNALASKLRRSSTGTIALIEFNKAGRPYYWGNLPSFDWFFGRAMRGVQKVIGQSPYLLRFYKVSNRQELEDLQSQCDGMLAYDVDSAEEQHYFDTLSIPYVLSHHLEPVEQTCCIRTDNRFGGRLQGEYLKECCCKRPLYVSGYLSSVKPHQQRLDGFLEIFPNAVVLTTSIDSPKGIDEILDQVNSLVQSRQVDGLAAVNDLTLFNLLMKCPISLSMVGYDASPFTSLMGGNSASIDIRCGDLYEEATRRLLELLSGGKAESTVINPVLVVAGRAEA